MNKRCPLVEPFVAGGVLGVPGLAGAVRGVAGVADEVFVGNAALAEFAFGAETDAFGAVFVVNARRDP